MWTLRMLALTRMRHGDNDAAQAALEEALALAREIDEPYGVWRVTLSLGEVAQARGDVPLAHSLYAQVLAMAEAARDEVLKAWAAQLLAVLFLDRSDYASARAWLGRGFLAHPAVAPLRGRMLALWAAAALAAAEGRSELALRLAGAVGRLSETHGFALDQPPWRSLDRWLEAARRALGAEATARAEAAGRAMTDEQAIAAALAEPGLAHNSAC